MLKESGRENKSESLIRLRESETKEDDNEPTRLTASGFASPGLHRASMPPRFGILPRMYGVAGVTRVLATVLLAAVASCSVSYPYRQKLMPAPTLFTTAGLDPFDEGFPPEEETTILYATDRAPAQESDRQPFYRNARGRKLRIGAALVRLTDGVDRSPEEVARATLSPKRERVYRLEVVSVEEFGMVPRSVSEFRVVRTLSALPKLQDLVTRRLARSHSKDVYVFVHGYRVVFENPILVTAELWHFLGYEGVFVAYSWPSTPNALAYFKDLETAHQTARNLRLFIETLSEIDAVRRIHIIGYSAGTRVVAGALHQLSLEGKRQKLGHVILAGSDVDRDLFAGMLDDGMLDVVDSLTIYQSAADKALGAVRFLASRHRVGELLGTKDMDPAMVSFLRLRPKLTFINVTEAEGATSGNGHGYFRSSPWTSSDILLTLYLGLPPAERGLARMGDLPIWRFPDDYPARLKAAVAKQKGMSRRPVETR